MNFCYKNNYKTALIAGGMALFSHTAMAVPIILEGSDYFLTSGAGFFHNNNHIGLTSNAITAPTGTIYDTRIERERCDLINGSCTIGIELMELSLEGGGFLIREDPNRNSTGTMVINLLTNNGSTLEGTFSSSFTVFFEYSMDNGNTWLDMENLGITPYILASNNSTWTSAATFGTVANIGEVCTSDGTDLITTDPTADRHEIPLSCNGQVPPFFDFYTDRVHETGVPNPINGDRNFHSVISFAQFRRDGNIIIATDENGNPIPVAPTALLFGFGLFGLSQRRKKISSNA